MNKVVTSNNHVEQALSTMCWFVDCLTSLKELSKQRAEAAIEALQQMSLAGDVSVYSEEVRRQVQVLRDLGHVVRFASIEELENM